MTNSGLKTILEDCLQNISLLNKNEENKIIAFVPKKYNYPNIEYKVISMSKKSWFLRIYYEWIYFYLYSKKNQIDTWFSLHDISPNVKAVNKITYFHNPIPFYQTNKMDWLYDFKIALFSKFYLNFYQINSKKLTHIIVQQNFIKRLFQKKGFQNILVAKPITQKIENFSDFDFDENKLKFIYPSEAKVFKNHIIIAEALQLLTQEEQKKIEIYFTFSPKAKRYTKYFFKKYRSIFSIKYLNWLTKNDLYGFYDKVDALLFPSKLETWGLPISEFKQFEKPIIISDLEYAKESLGNYDKVVFFNPENAQELAQILRNMLEQKQKFIKVNSNEKPDFENWETLLKYIISL